MTQKLKSNIQLCCCCWLSTFHWYFFDQWIYSSSCETTGTCVLRREGSLTKHTISLDRRWNANCQNRSISKVQGWHDVQVSIWCSPSSSRHVLVWPIKFEKFPIEISFGTHSTTRVAASACLFFSANNSLGWMQIRIYSPLLAPTSKLTIRAIYIDVEIFQWIFINRNTCRRFVLCLIIDNILILFSSLFFKRIFFLIDCQLLFFFSFVSRLTSEEESSRRFCWEIEIFEDILSSPLVDDPKSRFLRRINWV